MGRQKELTQEQKDIIHEVYVVQKRGQDYTAKAAGTTPYLLKKYLQKTGIHIRNKHEAIVSENHRRAYNIDEHYFSSQNSNMAWLLGFLASDGCVSSERNEIIIHLAKADLEILERIKTEIKSERPITTGISGRGYEFCRLAWTCSEHVKDLAKYNIIPQKTYKLMPPFELDKRYWIDYIRGYFDGDGSINLIKNSNERGKGSLRWQVASATECILDFILTFFEKEYSIPKVCIQERETNGKILYTIQYSSVATRTIYHILYNTDSTLWLKRKKEHFEEIIKTVNSDLTY